MKMLLRPNPRSYRRHSSLQVDVTADSSYWTCGLPRTEIPDQPQQYPRAGIDVGGFDMLVGMMADAAAAPHEHHGDIGDVDHRHAVVPCPARQFEHTMTLPCNGLRHLALEPGSARHGAVLVGDVELQHELAAFGDIFDSADNVGHRELAVRIRGRADIDGERYLSRDDIGRTGHGMDVSDGPDQAVFVGPAELFDFDNAFRSPRQRIAPQQHRHG